MNCDKCGASHPVMDTRYCEEVVARESSQPTPTVAKIAAEVAADLEDYVEVNDGYYEGYRTADAQEMIERALAPLEAELSKANAEIAQIRHAAFPDGAPKGYNPDLSEAVKQVRQSSTQYAQRYAILSKTRERELDQHTQEREELQARLATAEAELKAYREGGLTEEILRRNDGYIKVGKGCAIVVAKEQP